MDPILSELANQSTCEIRTDQVSRCVYSVDASIYEVKPSAVIIPRTKSDIVKVAQMAFKHNIPLTPRGAATGITGGCLGTGWIVDTSKYLSNILEVNFEQEYAVIEPGVIQDHLNGALSQNNYRLGPDTSTGNRATLGGMVANNAAGARSLRFGKMVDHVQSVELILASGEVLEFGPLSSSQEKEKLQQQGIEGHIYRTVAAIRTKYADEISSRFPHLPRRVSGYNLDELMKPGPFNLCKLIAGSEGSLGILSKIKVSICKKPKVLTLCIVHFTDLLKAFEAVSDMLQFSPIALELIDDKILATGRKVPSMKGKLDWLNGDPHAMLVAEFEGETGVEAQEKTDQFAEAMKAKGIGYAWNIITEPVQMSHVWEVRKAGLGILLSKRSYSRAIAFIEDLSIAPHNLAKFMGQFLAYLKSKGKEAGIYGHAGSGCMHIRPYIDLRNPDERKLMHQMMLDVTAMLLEHGGALSGEHGDGLIRSWLNEKMFGSKLYQAFLDLKNAFDPRFLMNPGKIVQGPPLEQNLRRSPLANVPSISTFQDFSKEKGFELAVDLCNGNGLCRKAESVMCPSFQVSGDEYDTTRARAQALRSVINGQLTSTDWPGEPLKDILDLCIECKGCKTECPSSVDMAKMKAEFLYQYQEKYGYPFRTRLFAHIDSLFKMASPFARLFNWAGSRFLTKLMLNWIGIAPQRSFPKLAPLRFSEWFQKHHVSEHQGKKTVVLFNDTYTEFNEPEIGIAAVKILEALGYQVLVPPWKCCGRPLISKGLLKEAQQHMCEVVQTFAEYAKQGFPIIGLEPSCILTVKDDFQNLLKGVNTDPAHLEAIIQAATTLDEFLHLHIKQGQFHLNFNPQAKEVKLHGHCHQKSLVGTKPTIEVLRAIPHFTVSEIDSGCCGMAGSFGYEKEHYEFSLKIAELKLAPAVRSAPKEALIVANGISCRSQIEHTTGTKAKHLAEALADAMI